MGTDETGPVKNFIFVLLFLAKIVYFWLDPHISDAKTEPFIPFRAGFFIFESHRYSNNIKNNW